MIRKKVRVEGIVQGVGFRPFVFSLATRLRLAGRVGNDVHGVFAEVEGAADDVERFLTAVRTEAPPLAVVDSVVSEPTEPVGAKGFEIVPSDGAGACETLVSADSGTCEDCLREVLDPDDRRFGYAFTNCTNCGPRFTIVRDIPYDRRFTTMSGFAMCARCGAEYHDQGDRRFHAQPVCCPDCGPRLRFLDGTREVPGDPLALAAGSLLRGEILAVKGLGGYHLAVDATNEEAAAVLRKRKHREDKPFAVMASTVDDVDALCEVGESERDLLISRRRPIVLLSRRPDSPVAETVAPGTRELGVMLPYTPLHHLLLRRFTAPIVLTSGNLSEEPIAYRDDDAFARLSGIADGFLTHNRTIHVRTDDSVARSFRGHPMLVRRSRGYAPQPVAVPWDFPRPVLSTGAELKNTFCLAKNRHAFVSHHIGDLENYETLRSFTDGIGHFQRLFDIRPEIVAHDLHPEYLSTKYALEQEHAELVGIQHHHAHIASCLADNREAGPVIGVAFDGLGYGTDGTIWGGEFLVADLTGFRRAAYLVPVTLPGGTTAIRQPWRVAASYLSACFGTEIPPQLGVMHRNERDWPAVMRLVRHEYGSPRTSSAGRLFDAVAAVLGVRDIINYEGQAAIELEQLADRHERGSYPVRISGEDALQVQAAELVRAVTEDLLAGAEVPLIAARFHNSVADLITAVCSRLRADTGLAEVALSGGVFQNMLLLDRTVSRLEKRNFRVLTHSRVPANDGGISLGQAVVAAALDRRSTGGSPV